MSVPRWLAMLPLSLAVHVAVVVGAVTLLRTEPTPPALMIDLDAIIVGRDDGPGGASSASGGVTGTPAPRTPPAAQSRSSAPPAAPSPPPPRGEAIPQRPADPIPAAAPEPAPTPPPTASPSPSPVAPSQPVAPTPSAPTDGRSAGSGVPGTGSINDAQASASAQGAGGGAGERTERGAGGGGNALLAAVAPGTGGGLGEGVGSEYAAYYARLRQRIQESVRYPPAARRRSVSGTVHLEIAIAPDGAISAVSVNASSSHEILDQAAMEAARSVRRVPFPPDVRPLPLRVRLPVVFELQ